MVLWRRGNKSLKKERKTNEIIREIMKNNILLKIMSEIKSLTGKQTMNGSTYHTSINPQKKNKSMEE